MYKSPVDGDKQNNMERYRSGHNEAVLKTVWVNARVGSNPTLCAMSARLFGLADDF